LNGYFKMDEGQPQPSPYEESYENAMLGRTVNESAALANQSKGMQYQLEEQEKNLAEAQLDCEETLAKINHLLKQDILKLDPETQTMEWFALPDQKKRVLTDEGVDKIMQVMQSYINKETLLSNFDEDTIKRRMLKFALALSALLFLKYELYFRSPSLEECQTILKERINDKVKKKMMAKELLMEEFNEKEERKLVVEELKPRMEYELSKIRTEQIKLNLREFEMIFTQLEALVEATHNRAWKGEERGSLRRHFNISEVIGGSSQRSPEKKKWGLF